MKIICDIDGTVADNTHREHYITGIKKDYDKFYDPALIALDKPIEKAVSAIQRILAMNTDFMYLTGRRNNTLVATNDWLRKHGIWRCVYAREDGDRRPAVVYKEETISKITSGPISACPLFIDDDPRNEAMYWKYGIPLHAPDCWDNFMIGKKDTWGKK